MKISLEQMLFTIALAGACGAPPGEPFEETPPIERRYRSFPHEEGGEDAPPEEHQREHLFQPSPDCKEYAHTGIDLSADDFAGISCFPVNYSFLIPAPGVQLRFHNAFGEVDPCHDAFYFGPASLAGFLPGEGSFCYATISPEAEDCLCRDEPCQPSQGHRGWYQCGSPDWF
ncbi:MAG: hypothetical protein Q8R53_00165 [Nanoarchaeota archaeon]|nr:hypothetical protein [Nanoarchaeota archaeon]